MTKACSTSLKRTTEASVVPSVGNGRGVSSGRCSEMDENAPGSRRRREGSGQTDRRVFIENAEAKVSRKTIGR